MNEAIKAFIRLIVAGILLLNSVLTAKGMNPIPFDETAFTDVALQVATGLSVLWVWWKNNNVTGKARATKAIANMVTTGEATVTLAEEADSDDEATDEVLETEYGMED